MSLHNEINETLERRPYIFGIAVSNLANDINPDFQLPEQLPQLISYLGREYAGAELQLESVELPSIESAIPQSLPFLGIHLPIQGINLQEENMREKSKQDYLNIIDFAHSLGADYVVTHMLTHEEWDRLHERENMIAQAKIDFYSILSEAMNKGYNGAILFENLEFPLYPSTRDEIVDCVRWIREISTDLNCNAGFALDISHLWHTGSLLNINRAKGNVIEKQLNDPFVNLHVTFEIYLAQLLDIIQHDVQLIHLTGSAGHNTHNMPSITNEPGITEHEALDLGASMKVLKEILSDNHAIWVVNEAHHFNYEAMVKACTSISNYMNL